MIKLFFISLIFFTVTLTGFSQKLKFKIEGQKDTTIFLVKY